MKIDYSKIDWNAQTNWGFCGTKENLRTVWERYWEYLGIRAPIEEFAYEYPCRGLAFAKGDVVIYSMPGQAPRYATVTNPACHISGYTYLRLSNGENVQVHPSHIPSRIAIAGVPEELLALVKAETGKPVDPSKCPLKKPACMEE